MVQAASTRRGLCCPQLATVLVWWADCAGIVPPAPPPWCCPCRLVSVRGVSARAAP